MKNFSFTVIFVLVGVLANAQNKYPNKPQFSIGITAGVPTGNTADTHAFLLGGFVQQSLPIAKALFVTINAGYSKFIGKSNVDEHYQDAPLVDYPNMDLIAVTGGIKYFLSPVFYLQGQIGVAAPLNSKQNNYDAITPAFIYSPKIGVTLPLASSNSVDISLKYEATNKFAGQYAGNISSLSVGLAYGF